MEMPRRIAPHLVIAGVVSLIFGSAPVRSEVPARPAPRPLTEWVKKSNENAKIMVELMAKLAARGRVAVWRRRIRRPDLATCRPALSPGRSRRFAWSTPSCVRRLSAETDPRVKQDLEILVKAAADMIKEAELSEKLLVPYFSLDMLIFGSFRGLLDDQVAASRRPAALVRLRKYAGLEPGTKPITEHAMAYCARADQQSQAGGADQVEDPEGPGSGVVPRRRHRQVVREVQDRRLRTRLCEA